MNFLAVIKEKIGEYAKAYLSLLKLNVVGKTASVVSYLMFFFIALFLLFAVIIFLGFGLTEGFVALGLSRVGATFSTVGVFVFMLTLLFAFRKGITDYFAGVIISIMTEGDDTEASED